MPLSAGQEGCGKAEGANEPISAPCVADPFMKQFLLKFFTWWNGQTFGTQFTTWRDGERVGEDGPKATGRKRDGAS